MDEDVFQVRRLLTDLNIGLATQPRDGLFEGSALMPAGVQSRAEKRHMLDAGLALQLGQHAPDIAPLDDEGH